PAALRYLHSFPTRRSSDLVIAVHALAFVAGAALVVWVLLSAVVTVVLPRGESATLTRAVFLSSRRVFVFFARRARAWETADRIIDRKSTRLNSSHLVISYA